MVSRSSICHLLNVTVEDQMKALGEDRIAVVRGRRRSALKYLRKELLDNPEDDGRGYDGKSIVRGGGCIPSVERKRKGRRPLVTFQNTASQTDPYHRLLLPHSAQNDKRLPTLSCQPRDIQLSPPVHLAEVSRPGARFTREGKLTQTPVDLAGPDVLNLPSVLRNLRHEDEDRNVIPNIKLNLWAPNHYRRKQKQKERDSEWLEQEKDIEHEASSGDEEEQGRTENVNHYCDKLMKALGLLFLVMKIGGRWPFKRRVNADSLSFELKWRSLPCVVFLLTFFVHLYVTVISIFNTTSLIRGGESAESEYDLPVYMQIQRLEFDKYWHYAFWTYVTAIFVIVWNFILLIDGMSIHSLLTRWTLAVSKMKYDPTANIRMATILFSWMSTVYALVLTICCFTDIIPAVRGSAGLIGSLFFSHSFPRIRFSRYFYLVRIFGLLFHLYTVYAAEVAILFIWITTKLIQNSASNWNLRLALKLQMPERSKRCVPYKATTYRVDISLSTLLAEHRVITSFSRHTAEVFHTSMNMYLLTKGLEMVLLMYRSLAFLLIPDQVRFDTTHVQGEIGNSGDTVVYKDSDAQRHLTCFFVTGMVIASWFTTSMGFVKCGEVILRASRFVARYGFIVCKSTKERMFIQTISMQFAPVLEYTMKAASPYNRRTILQLFIWVLIFTLGLLSFNPFNLQKDPITVCTPGGGLEEPSCITITMSRISKSPSGKDPLAYLDPTRSLPPLEVIRCTGTDAIDDISGELISTQILGLFACDVRRRIIYPFNSKNTGKCFSDFGATHNEVPNESNAQPYMHNSGLHNCETRRAIDPARRDDCGNLAFEATAQEPVALFFRDPTAQGGTVEKKFVCCYSYPSRPGNDKSLPFCHAQSPAQIWYACGKKAVTQPSDLSCFRKPPPEPCPSTWDTYLGETSTTSVLTYELQVAHVNDLKTIYPYKDGYCAGSETVAPYSGVNRQDMVDSETGNPIGEVDDCGNVRLGNAQKVLVTLASSDAKGQVTMICANCYNYEKFGPKNKESLKYCHMQSSAQAAVACRNGANFFKVFSEAPRGVSRLECPKRMKTFQCDVEDEWRVGQLGADHPPAKVTIIAASENPDSGIPLPPFSQRFGGTCYVWPLDGDENTEVTHENGRPYSTAGLPTLHSTNQNTGTPIAEMERDDCGNLAHVAPGLIKKKAVVLKNLRAPSGVKPFNLVCCFDYYFMPGNDVSLQMCHTTGTHRTASSCDAKLSMDTKDLLPQHQALCD